MIAHKKCKKRLKPTEDSVPSGSPNYVRPRFIAYYYKLHQSKHTLPSERTLKTQLAHDDIREFDTGFGSPGTHIQTPWYLLFIGVRLLFLAIDTLFTSLEPLIYHASS